MVPGGGVVKSLTFKGRFIEPILAGTKTTTLRRPSSRLPRLGERVNLICQWHRPAFAVGEVTEVRDVALDSLTDADAIADGYPDAESLRAAVIEMLGLGDDPNALPFEGSLGQVQQLRLIRFCLVADVLE